MKRSLILTLTTALGATLMAAPATSDELAVVGSWSGLPLHRQFEAPFWNDVLSEVTQGSLSSALTTHDQMGIGGGDVFRMLGDGVFDVGMTVADYAVSDAPELEGLDV
ncbi:MAG: C4-dicarboxylate ABC transporter substrate-binding protein, partial [Devosiaceae bacterium]